MIGIDVVGRLDDGFDLLGIRNEESDGTIGTCSVIAGGVDGVTADGEGAGALLGLRKKEKRKEQCSINPD